VGFIVVLAGLWLFGRALFQLLEGLWLHASRPGLWRHPGAAAAELLQHATQVLLWGTVSVSALAAVGGMAGSFLQVGPLVAWERIKPDVNRLNPGAGFKRIFSTRNLVNLVKMVVKTLLLGGLMFAVIRSLIDPALASGYGSVPALADFGAHALLLVFGWAAVIYAAMAAVDYVHEHHEFIKGLRMSIEEIRREHKDTQGNPIHQARRRAAHFEAVYASLGDRVRAASAVIHSARVAVALQYLGEHDLPRVIARGEGEVAATIRRFAAEALKPMEFEPRLAEQLYDEVGVDQPIPRPLYEPVARLLRWAQGA
jgi:type III secretion protein U